MRGGALRESPGKPSRWPGLLRLVREAFGNGTGFAVALEAAGAHDVVVEMRAVEPTRASFAARWR
jgi:hypothetical protein